MRRSCGNVVRQRLLWLWDQTGVGWCPDKTDMMTIKPSSDISNLPPDFISIEPLSPRSPTLYSEWDYLCRNTSHQIKTELFTRSWEGWLGDLSSHSPFKHFDRVSHFLSKLQCMREFLWFQSKQCHLVVCPSPAVRAMGTISAGMPCYHQPWARCLLTSYWLLAWHPGLWLGRL